MGSIARTDRIVDCDSAKAGMALSAHFEEVAMRRTFVAVRDTLIVLGLQLVFRTVMLLRRWNY
jgi:hypothetical protein